MSGAVVRRSAIACAIVAGLGATISPPTAAADAFPGENPDSSWTASSQSGTITIGMPDLANSTILPSTSFDGDLRIDMSEWAGAPLASLSLEVQWDPLVATYVDASQPAVGTLVLDESSVATGTLTLSWSDATGISDDLLLSALGFTASTAEGNSLIGIEVTEASTAGGDDVISSVALTPVPFCVGASGVLGDVTDDGLANIIDAQQIARFGVGLSVSATVLERINAGAGDATLDGSTNIIDAQQVARFGVGLSASPGIGDPLPGGC